MIATFYQDKKYTKIAWRIFQAQIFENVKNKEPRQIFIVLIIISTKKVLIDVARVVAKTIHHSRHLLGRFQKATDISLLLETFYQVGELQTNFRQRTEAWMAEVQLVLLLEFIFRWIQRKENNINLKVFTYWNLFHVS